jgi:hypothetical protein
MDKEEKWADKLNEKHAKDGFEISNETNFKVVFDEPQMVI